MCRNHHVYQLSVQPTWKTAVVRKRLKGSLNNFQIELMDGPFIYLCSVSLNVTISVSFTIAVTAGEACYLNLFSGSWSSPALSQVYHLGNKINFQVSAHHLSPGEKIYINSCYAKPSSGSQSPLKYTIVGHFG